MVHRAEPFPPPPAEAGDDRLKFIQPVIFAKKPSFAGSPTALDIGKEDAKSEDAVRTKLRGICRGC